MNQAEHLEKERREANEYTRLLIDVRAVISKPEGKALFRYLLKTLKVAQLPDEGLLKEHFHEQVGAMRAGNIIWRLIANANPDLAAELLAKIEKERYDEISKA